MTHSVTYLQAIIEAQREEMVADDRVFLMGEDVSWSMMGTTAGLVEQFGPARVRDTPISEAGFVGAGAGAALAGMRPIVEILMAPFLYPAMDQIVSIIAKSTYLYGGQASVPIVLRAPLLYGHGNAAQHSDRPYATLQTIPGLKIAIPSTAYDVKGLLKTAVRDNDPVFVFEDARCWNTQSEVPDDPDFTIPFGEAAIRREGTDVTIVAIASGVVLALQAAEELERDGVSVEVIDPRTIVPLDLDRILASVAKTGRLVLVDPAHETGSVASQISALVAERGFWDLQAPIVRVTTPQTHVPFSAVMEHPLYPNVPRILDAVRRTLDVVEG